MSASNSTNQVPTASSNTQATTPNATAPNYGGVSYPPTQAPAQVTGPAPALMPAAAPSYAASMLQGGGAGVVNQGGTSATPMPTAAVPAPVSNPFSTPAQTPAAQSAPVSNPFSATPAPPAQALPTGAGWNQGTQSGQTLGMGGTALPTASGDFTFADGQGVFTNAQGYSSQASAAAAAAAKQAAEIAESYGYSTNNPNQQTFLQQYAAGNYAPTQNMTAVNPNPGHNLLYNVPGLLTP